MATQIMLLVQVDDTKITPSVIINPHYGSQGFANPPRSNSGPPRSNSGLMEAYTVNEVHREVLDFANNLQTKEESSEEVR